MKKHKQILSALFVIFSGVLLLASCGKTKNNSFSRDDYKVDLSKETYSISFRYQYYDGVDSENIPNLVTQFAADSLLLNEGTELKWLPTAPEREGYTFEGWYVDAALSTPFYHEVMPKGNIEAYARYVLPNDTIYVSADGAYDATGTSRSKAMNLWDAARCYKAGATIRLLPGNYDLTKTVVFGAQGDSNHITKVVGDTSEGGVKLRFYDMRETDTNQGIKITGNYHNLSDITVMGAGDNGLLLGSSNNIIQNCNFTECHDTGLQISRYSGSTQPTIETWPSNNLILNCSSYNNADDGGEDADGFAAKLTVGHNNVFDGCIAYWNVDDGWDLYAKQDSGPIGLVKIINCVSFQNGRNLTADYTGINDSFSGDGNGFKLGGSSVPGQVIVENCIAAYNYAHGFTDNSNPGVISISNCTSFNNGEYGDKEYDNFNLNRSQLLYKNYYSGLLSYYTTSSKNTYNLEKRSDEFYGSVTDSILYYRNVPYLAEGSLTVQVGDGFNTAKQVSTTSFATSPLTSVTLPTALLTQNSLNPNLNTILRNSDGSVNMGTTWAVNTSLYSGMTIGADLTKTSSSSYNHATFTTVGTNETTEQALIREVYDSIDLSVNSNAVYNDIYLPTLVQGVEITWSSNNTTAIAISTQNIVDFEGISHTYGLVAPKLLADTVVELTATIKVGKSTLTKTFSVTVKEFDARVGTITGISDVTLLDTETLPDINDYTIFDYTSTSVELIKGTDYTEVITISYQTAEGEASSTVSSLSTTPGIYTVNYSFTITGYAAVTKKAVITVVNHLDTASVKEATTGGYVIDNAFTISGTASYHVGEVYVVAVDAEENRPTQADMLTNYTSTTIGTGYASNVCKFDLSSLKFSYTLTLGSSYVAETSVEVYMFIKNENGNGELYHITNIRPQEIINTASELYDALSNAANNTTAYKLGNNIDCENTTWNQTATSSIFKGYFDGAYYTISNLNIVVTGTDGGGLFFKVSGATIKNLSLEEVHVNENYQETLVEYGKVGILIGEVKAGVTVENINMYNCGVTGSCRVGGVIGQVTGDVSGQTTTVKNVAINVSTYSNSNYHIRAYYTTTNNSSGQEAGASGKYVGGIIAHVQYPAAGLPNNLYVSNCYVNSRITCQNQFTAGIVGRIDPRVENSITEISNCVFAGNLTGSSSYAAGIIAGRASGTLTIKNCVCYGSVSEYDSKDVEYKDGGKIISTQLCTKTVIGTTTTYALASFVTMENCYWQLQDWSIEDESYPNEEEYIAHSIENKDWYGTYIYASKLKTNSTWTELGFDLENTWVITSTNNQGLLFHLQAFAKA